jgi:aryl-alcohol dehydrogenase-like predicted oxidoreductase
MRYGSVNGIAKPVSKVVLGTMIIANAGEEYERSAKLLDAALAQGVTCLDTANVYGGGQSEMGIGRWFKERGAREQMVVLTKGCIPSQVRSRVTPFDMAADIHESLARLQTDYLDIWMLHRDDERVPVGEIVEWLNEHVRAGRIRAFGGSNWRHQRLAEGNAYAKAKGLVGFSCSSPNFGLAEQVQDPWGPGCVTISGPAEAPARDWYRDHGIPVFAYSSLARGLLSGRISRENLAEGVAKLDHAARTAYCHEVNYQRLDRCWELGRAMGLTVPQVATAWLMAQPLPVHALVGAASPEELANTIAGAEVRLSAQEAAWLDLRAAARAA